MYFSVTCTTASHSFSGHYSSKFFFLLHMLIDNMAISVMSSEAVLCGHVSGEYGGIISVSAPSKKQPG